MGSLFSRGNSGITCRVPLPYSVEGFAAITAKPHDGLRLINKLAAMYERERRSAIPPSSYIVPDRVTYPPPDNREVRVGEELIAVRKILKSAEYSMQSLSNEDIHRAAILCLALRDPLFQLGFGSLRRQVTHFIVLFLLTILFAVLCLNQIWYRKSKEARREGGGLISLNSLGKPLFFLFYQ